MNTYYVPGPWPWMKFIINGTKITRHNNGNVWLKTVYVDGRKHGVESHYYETGELYWNNTWVNGKRTGPHEIFDKLGNTEKLYYFKDGMLQP